MTETTPEAVRPALVDKTKIRQIVAEQNQRMGFIPDPTASPEKAQAMMRALGIRPEDNLFSRGIITAREED